MIIEVSLITIAVCMVILLIVAVIIGINLSKGIRSIEYKVENALDEVSTTLCQATTTLNTLNELTVSIKGKVDATDPLFHIISRVGAIADGFISGARPEFNLSNIINFSRTPSDNIKASEIAELIGLGVLLWQKFKRRN